MHTFLGNQKSRPISICGSKKLICNNHSKHIPGSSGNVVITGSNRPQILSTLANKGFGKWVQINAPTNMYGSRTGAPHGFGESPKNHLQ
jgi:hypothetical protein